MPDTTPGFRSPWADDRAPDDVLEAIDVRWRSHALSGVTYTVAAIEPAEDGKLTISFTSANDHDRTYTVPADRRFMKAQQ